MDTTELRISYEGFKSTVGIGRATKLKKIVIVECQQEIHFDEIEKCVSLKEVQLVRSPVANKYNLDNVSCRIFADLSNAGFNVEFIPPNVTALKLTNCGLTKVPHLQGFSKLVDVRFGGNSWNINNKFDVVDEANLPKDIQILDFSGCNLTIQPDLRQFESLIDLNLGWNQQIQKIDQFRFPKKLQKLNVSFCGLAEQPDLHLLVSLLELSLQYNIQMNNIEVCKLSKQQQKLNLRNCDLMVNYFLGIQKIDVDKIPKQILKLELCGCDLMEQPDLHLLNSLIELNLRKNQQIQNIQSNKLPTHIEVLDLSGSETSSLFQLCNCTQLKELDVSDCKIKDINQLQALKLMPELQRFICYDNDICKNQNILKALALSLAPTIQYVKIDDKNIANEVKQLQNDLNNTQSPFIKSLGEMLDEQFYEDHKVEMIQMQIDVCVQKCVASYVCGSIQNVKLMKEKVDEECNLIVRVLVGEQ